MKQVKRIFFDSGMILVYPKSGHWFYPQVYKDYCKSNNLPESTFLQKVNYRKAYKYLDSVKTVRTLHDEEFLYQNFYKHLFHGIHGKDNKELIDMCTNAKVYDKEKYAFYDDVENTIATLYDKYKLGIISDAWPSLLSVYENKKMDRYFTPFIISSMNGCTKESHELFNIALSQISETPEECLFVDDSYGNCKRATEVGMNAVILNRNKYERDRGTIKAI